MTNLEKIIKGISEQSFDAILLLSPQNRRYATGLATSSGAVLVHQSGGVFMTDFRYIEAARKISGFEVQLTSHERNIYDLINGIIEKNQIKTLAIEETEMTVALHQKYSGVLNSELVFEEGFLSSLRAVKDETEKRKLKRATAIADAALSDVLPMIRRGVTETGYRL